MSSARVSRKKNDLVPNNRFNPVGYFSTALFPDIAPDLDKIVGCFGRKNVTTAHSGLAFKSAR
jgi:hypothetical protein